LLISLLTAGCSLSSTVMDNPIFGDTSTPLPPPTSTATSTPPPTPTPVPATRIKQAEQLFFYGDYDAARTEFQTTLNQAGDAELRAAAQLGLGRISYINKDYNQATQAFITIIEYYSDTSSYAPAIFYLAQTYSNQEQYKQAAEAYAKYLSVHPSALNSYVNQLRAEALTSTGDIDGAIMAYQAAIDSSITGDTSQLKLEIGKLVASKGDNESAITIFMGEYDATSNEYVKSTANLLAGRSYLSLGMPEQAYARFQDSVKHFRQAYDSYSALVALVNDNQPVSELDRGIIDYNVGQYGLAIDALNRYIQTTPDHDGDAHYYKGLAAQAIGDYQTAIEEWTALINDHPDNAHWLDAWQDKAFTLWYYLYRYDQAAQTMFDFVSLYPAANQAADFLFQAGRIQERNNKLSDAAYTWDRMIKEYPGAEISSRGLFLSGITQYRLKNYNDALTVFQRYLVLSNLPDDQASALMWIGKCQQKLGASQEARTAWEQAVQYDPQGFYGIRSRELILNIPPLVKFGQYDFDYDLEKERPLAESWLRSTFTIPAETDLNGMGELSSNPHLETADALYELGFYNDATAEYDLLRNEIIQDPLNNYRLLNHLLERRLYRPAILISRQILDLAGMDDYSTRNAPVYFNHIRYGVYYKEILLPVAEQNNLDPIVLFSLIRQESFFEGFAGSSAGAMGLMQLMPATGKEIANNLNYPANFQNDDLFRPVVNIRLGANYFAHQRDYFGDDIYKMLAAYNAGPGRETQEWITNSQDDPDLFIEVVRYSETRTYLINISMFINQYRWLYEKNN
ncbi:MAG: transglycosylase SLT domain-containing protein, partial [Anaerolineae bacterium]|nr:transglycosylase SLT domain-containing protein [Anaerolineae bacterium]